MANIEDMTPIDCLASKIWAGTRWHYPHIERMVKELRELRKVHRAAAVFRDLTQSNSDDLDARWNARTALFEATDAADLLKKRPPAIEEIQALKIDITGGKDAADYVREMRDDDGEEE